MSSQAQAKVLRIGLFQGGRLIEERLLRTPGPVTVGSDYNKGKSNMFVLPASDLPASQSLFDYNKATGRYTLQITKEMSGRIKRGDEIATLQEIVTGGKATRNAQGGFSLELTPDAQGRVVIGEATLLFQHVIPPPLRPPPILPASMRGGWVQGMDRILASVLALSFIFHVGFVAFLELQDWPQPLEAEYSLPDRFVQIEVEKPDEPEPEPEPTEPTEPGDGEPTEAPAEPKPAPKQDEPKEAAPKNDADAQARAEADRKRRLADKVQNSTILAQLGAKSSDGSTGSLLDTLQDGAGKTSITDAFAGSSGVASATPGAEKSGLRSGGSSDGDGTGATVGIGELGPSKGAARAGEGVNTGGKTEAKVKSKIDLKGPEQVIGGKLDASSINDLIRRNQAKIQQCHERELKNNPKAGGRVVIMFVVGQVGRVTSAKATVDGVGGGVAACTASVIKNLRFPKPSGGDATVSKTFVFSPGS